MQKIITKQNGRYKMSFAHWTKTQRLILGISIFSGILFSGWLAFKNESMPYWFQTYIWNNISYIYPVLLLLLIAYRSGKKLGPKV